MDGGGETTILQLHQWYVGIKWMKIKYQIFRADRILQNNDIGSCSDSCIDASTTIVRTQKFFSKTLCTQSKVVKRSYLLKWHWADWSRATAHGLLFKISPAFVFFLPTQSTHRYIHLSIHKLGKLFHQLLNTLWWNFPDPKLKARAPLTFKPTHLTRFKRVAQGYTFKTGHSLHSKISSIL